MFYSCKAIWKKTQEFGLQRNFKDLPDVNELVRRAAALPLLPLDKVENYWLHTLEDAPDREDCTKLTDSVTETWKKADSHYKLGTTTRPRDPEPTTI